MIKDKTSELFDIIDKFVKDNNITFYTATQPQRNSDPYYVPSVPLLEVPEFIFVDYIGCF